MPLLYDLNATTALLLADLDADPFAGRLLAGGLSASEYAFFLVQTHHYVVQTRPLLARAAHRLRADGRHPALAALFARKAAEETGHDRWIRSDLRAIGHEADLHPDHLVPPTEAVDAYVAWNNFTVDHGSPIAFLGTAYVLEALAANRATATAQNLVQHSRIPNIARAVTFLRGHGDADVGHIDHLGRTLSRLAQSAAERADVLLSASITRALYVKLFTAPAARSASPPLDSAVAL